MTRLTRFLFATGWLILLAACASTPTKPPTGLVGIYSAGPGSAFLPYAHGLASYLGTKGLVARALESKGSIENLGRVDAEPQALGIAFLGTAFEAVNGSATWTQGRKHGNVRALFPTYETSFQVLALRSAGLQSLAQLSGKRVGVGPAGSPAESFLKGSQTLPVFRCRP